MLRKLSAKVKEASEQNEKEWTSDVFNLMTGSAGMSPKQKENWAKDVLKVMTACDGATKKQKEERLVIALGKQPPFNKLLPEERERMARKLVKGLSDKAERMMNEKMELVKETLTTTYPDAQTQPEKIERLVKLISQKISDYDEMTAKEKEKMIMDVLQKMYYDTVIIDVTAKATDEFVKCCPSYPNGGIPVPFTNDVSLSVEGIWQGLKVFENADVDTRLFTKSDMKGMKRNVSKLGDMKGYRKGVNGNEVLDEAEARKLIYLPCYKWVLDNKLQKLMTALRCISKNKPVVLIDDTLSSDATDPKRPISHASLIKAYIEGNYPE
jgi:hypothetical protein